MSPPHSPNDRPNGALLMADENGRMYLVKRQHSITQGEACCRNAEVDLFSLNSLVNSFQLCLAEGDTTRRAQLMACKSALRRLGYTGLHGCGKRKEVADASRP